MLSQSCLQPNWSPRQRLTAGTQGKHRVPSPVQSSAAAVPAAGARGGSRRCLVILERTWSTSQRK